MTAPTPAEISALAAFADQLADAARAAIMPYFRVGAAVENKAAGGFDPVTAADRAAERAIRDLIATAYPDHGVIGEEFPAHPAQGPYTWVIDPIDGTRAFIAGLPLWGTLIGLLHEGRPLLGVMDQGHIRERFAGSRLGATLTSAWGVEPLTTRAARSLSESVLATTDPGLFSAAERPRFEAVRARCRIVRYGCDCYAYAMLAAGHINLVIEAGLKPHDVVALIPLIEGAGGVMTNWTGGPAWEGGQILAASDPALHAEAMALLAAA
jgi:myo-inositol-1(or 4)-monophosphatase